MADDIVDTSAATEPSKTGPDYFTFYSQEIRRLLSSDDKFLPFSSREASEASKIKKADEKNKNRHTFCNEKESSTVSRSFSQGIGGKLSDFKKEQLKSLLKQTVASLSQEVDDMLDPILAIRQIQSQLKSRKSVAVHSAAACEGEVRKEEPRKKMKLSSLSSSDSDDEDEDIALPGIKMVNGAKKCCDICHTTETTLQRTGLSGSKSFCKLCALNSKQQKVSLSDDEQNAGSCGASYVGANTNGKEVDNDLQFLMENDTAIVESSTKKYSDELLMTLGHMEQQLEGVLDLLQSSNRLMTLTEKQQLQKLIQKLPPKNLDRVVEIIQENKPIGQLLSDVIHVDLEKEDNVTLWRLYIYVKAVENARKLAG